MSIRSEDLQQAWQRQALDAPRVSLAFVRHQSAALSRRARVRVGIEYVGGIAGVAFMLLTQWNFIVARPIFATSVALWIAAILYIMRQWKVLAGAREPAADLGTLDALRFYRQELERQRDARRGNWRWWLPPLVPCIVVMFVALFIEVQPTPWLPIGLLAAWVLVAVGLGIAGYERGARDLQREIDALDSLTKG